MVIGSVAGWWYRFSSLAVLLIVLFQPTVLLAVPTQPIPLAKGVLLIASEQLKDSRFSKSVVLLIHYGPEAASGLVINHPTDLELSKVMPQAGAIRPEINTVYWGGPVDSNGAYILIRTSRTHSKLHHVFDDLYTAQGMRTLMHVVGLLAPEEDLRAFAGFSGWGPGQLDAEVAHGDWYVAPADIESVYTQQPEGLWEKLIKLWAGQWI
ncbi:MAG: hypothetical protein A2V90_00365 [Gammaproteobacteria bacterium RBG_16_57_12]|nr:MAG: hypothetical protein A2V90_00365 [Gammaproteobacteria bacterium RBG_16_57_12]